MCLDTDISKTNKRVMRLLYIITFLLKKLGNKGF